VKGHQSEAGLEISTVPASAISTRMREEILDLCQRAYNEDLRAALEAFNDPIHVVGTIQGTIVSHALWITRWLIPNDGGKLRTAYIETVATDPLRQRRGYASAIMRALVEQVTDWELAALCTSDQGRSLYEKLGWETWRGPLYIRDSSGLTETPGETVLIHRLRRTPTIDLAGSLSAEWRPGELW
jgi:aminoglycoside 2'-N-acetyltransferase I